ncbi:hypothetical protein CEUSTIGMA_g4600.t1 [Chlamydomonas eustigma]|uniref:Uncharacterized protein n=1 Tax=Chlamydomonas eustigma TaxID=1157962 RepID=A0A250X277_9CHLO|nr:hypothetical protein CEUSTIGMA_g4600.t1 [Chlamydomonas eustigma]|eukprot:GAX77155.1 hypothetical protein CEUSTIGMA_g4600.t1 [Chlamydomonas eustigma]
MILQSLPRKASLPPSQELRCKCTFAFDISLNQVIHSRRCDPPSESLHTHNFRFKSRNISAPARGGGVAEPDGSDRAIIKEHMDKAGKLMDDMLNDILNELFAEQATSYISEEAGPPISEEEAVRKAVVQRIEFLDANFLGALNGYIQAVKRLPLESQDLLPLMELVQKEVLNQVSLRLPPAARVLNRALQDMDKEKRVKVLRSSLTGGAGDLPGSDTDSLVTAASQFIDDMEDQSSILDRRLLARLCLVREEVRWLGLESSFTGSQSMKSSAGESSSRRAEEGSDEALEGAMTADNNVMLLADAEELVLAAAAAGADGRGHQQLPDDQSAALRFYRSNVPQRSAIFVNQVVSVGDSTKRVALLSRAFCEDWEGAAPRQKAQNNAIKGQPDFVRPGRFMTTLNAIIMQLEMDGAHLRAKQKGLMQRLRDVQMEAVNVLDRMQRGELSQA